MDILPSEAEQIHADFVRLEGRDFVNNNFVLEKQKEEYFKIKINTEKLSDIKYQLEIDIQKMKTQYEFYMSQNSNMN